MARSHPVKQGESLYTIAAAYQIADWRTIWNHAGNAELRGKRKDPQILYPGDTVTLPDPSPGIVAKLDGRVELTVHRCGFQPIELHLLCIDFKPMADTEYKLSYGSGELQGKTDADGKLTAEIPLDVKKLELTAGDLRWELRPGDLNPLEQTDDEGLSGAQGRLKNLGLFDGEIDGKTSPALERALRRFQLQHDIPRSGVLDAETRDALTRRHGC
jgi:N-acetylmuramoyl-L-alanine amidase